MDATGRPGDNSPTALERIRALLHPETLPSDRRLPTERQLSEDLGVSRRSVRRALDVLEAEGRISRRRGAGTFAGPCPPLNASAMSERLAESDFMGVMEVRLSIEPPLAELAALRADARDAERLDRMTKNAHHSQDADGRELWDSAFHRTIAECAGNELYLAVFDLVDRVRQNAEWRQLRERARTHSALSLYAGQHDAIVESIRRRDPERAREAMRTHLSALRESVVRMMETGADDVG
ncbi:FadR/GntR family transcriptional regulator [Pararhizobium mangrovi]|uniref:FadR family transcriptional regulator n=1 Tax=Pararhizobium mangrovi TaxID=2590452 RepID=A0A506UA38_9HYPH|nr:FCD domain-containing protein [Pararhizobium mangrovi]TPW28677.1 FadR family transcriptional regulator [Pararhizobium mangrovi]